MHLLANVQLRNILVIWVVLMLLFIVSCRTEYTTQHFSFPPGSKPHESNWEYTLLIIVSSSQSPITKKSKKNVQIRVYDKSKTIFLEDNFEFVSASIEADIVWEKFEKIMVVLLETGNEYAQDSYNTHLVKSGPTCLIQLTYHYGQADKKFKRIN